MYVYDPAGRSFEIIDRQRTERLLARLTTPQRLEWCSGTSAPIFELIAPRFFRAQLSEF